MRRTWRRRRPIYCAAKSNAAPCEKPRPRCGERFASGAPREWSAHGACDIAAREQRTVGRGRIHDVKQRSVVRSRGALLRPGFSVSSHVPSLSRPPASPRGLWRQRPSRQQQFRPPMRGGWSADRPHSFFFGRACAARPPGPGATGTPLGAPPWRFSDADPRSRLPAVGPEPPATARAKRKCLAVGVRTSLRCGSRRVRGTPLLAPSFRIVSRKRPSEPGCESLYYKLDT